MCTRSYICIENDDGSYKGVYCHTDGYLTYNGAMLLDYYSDRKKVEKLISLGDIKTLNKYIDKNSRNRVRSNYYTTIFYGRDLGENNYEARNINISIFDDPNNYISYCYVFDKKNNWRFFKCGQLNDGLKDLKTGLEEKYKNLGFDRPKGYYGYYIISDKIYNKKSEIKNFKLQME